MKTSNTATGSGSNVPAVCGFPRELTTLKGIMLICSSVVNNKFYSTSLITFWSHLVYTTFMCIFFSAFATQCLESAVVSFLVSYCWHVTDGKPLSQFRTLLRCVIPVVCRKTNGELNFSHETQLW